MCAHAWLLIKLISPLEAAYNCYATGNEVDSCLKGYHNAKLHCMSIDTDRSMNLLKVACRKTMTDLNQIYRLG